MLKTFQWTWKIYGFTTRPRLTNLTEVRSHCYWFYTITNLPKETTGNCWHMSVHLTSRVLILTTVLNQVTRLTCRQPQLWQNAECILGVEQRRSLDDCCHEIKAGVLTGSLQHQWFSFDTGSDLLADVWWRINKALWVNFREKISPAASIKPAAALLRRELSLILCAADGGIIIRVFGV